MTTTKPRLRDIDGTPWPEHWATKALIYLKNQVARDMAARDLERGVGTGQQNPRLKHLRHTGRESRLELQARWAAFCAEPQSLAQWKDRL